MRIRISISSRGDAAYPEQFRHSSLEVKDLKGQNPSRWQLSSTLHHTAVKANKLSSSAFVFAPDLKAEKGIHASSTGGKHLSCMQPCLVDIDSYRNTQKKPSIARVEARGRLTRSKEHGHDDTRADTQPASPWSCSQHSRCPNRRGKGGLFPPQKSKRHRERAVSPKKQDCSWLLGRQLSISQEAS